uniref:Uncharacterized protein n=1 Tax=Leersia perrieri TaxID=77586 RepID=A0A0D9VWS0_9ORYZ
MAHRLVATLRWSLEEEAALSAGIAKHGVGKWQAILEDSEFSSTLWYRSNVNLKDKWRNMNATVITSLGHVKGKVTPKKIQAIPKNAHKRLMNVIMEAIVNLNEPTGSQKIAIANYIEEEYYIPSDFEHILSIIYACNPTLQVNRKYTIAPSSSYWEEQNPKVLKLEDTQRESQNIGSNDVEILTKAQVDAELARMASMTAEEAEAAAARAVEEAEAVMAEAKEAAREAEAAEADAQAAIAFAEATLLEWKNRNVAHAKLDVASCYPKLLQPSIAADAAFPPQTVAISICLTAI